MLKVKIKKLVENAVIPKYSKIGDAGLDLTATSKIYDKYGNVSYGTGLAFEIPTGYVGLLFPRSSICKQTIALSNAVGILDSGYRGEVFFKFKPTGAFYSDLGKDVPSSDTEDYEFIEFGCKEDEPGYDDSHNDYQIGERIGQIIILPYPQIEFEEVAELSETKRGSGGFGSTGK